MYPFYARIAKAGIKNVCIHKGLFAPAVAEKFPRLLPYADVSDIGKAAKDWPQLNFLVYHSGYRWVGGNPADAMAEFECRDRRRCLHSRSGCPPTAWCQRPQRLRRHWRKTATVHRLGGNNASGRAR